MHCWAFLVALLILSVELAIIVYLLTHNGGRQFFLDFSLIKITLWFWSLTKFIDNGSPKYFIFISFIFFRFIFLHYCKPRRLKIVFNLQENKHESSSHQHGLLSFIVFFDTRKERKLEWFITKKNFSEKNIKNLFYKNVYKKSIQFY